MQGVEIGEVTSGVGATHAPGVRLTSARATPLPFKRDRVRRIDCVIDYFGGGGTAAVTSFIQRRRMTGGLDRAVPEGPGSARSAVQADRCRAGRSA